MANIVLSKSSAFGSVFGYKLDYYKTDVAKSDGTTQCDPGCGICNNSSSECIGCNSGYFLKDGKCIEFPITSI